MSDKENSVVRKFADLDSAYTRIQIDRIKNEAYYRELRDFFESIKDDSEPSVSASDGLRTMEVIEEAYKFNDG